MASDHDDPEVVIKAEKSSDELREERRQAAERDGDVLDVSSDSDEAAPPMKRVKTEPKAEKVALSTHGSFDPPTLAHVEMAKAVKAHLEASGEFEVKEFVLATTRNSYVLRKNKSYLDGRDRERLITIAAKEQGLDWLRAVDGSMANSGTGFHRRPLRPDGGLANAEGGGKRHGLPVRPQAGQVRRHTEDQRNGGRRQAQAARRDHRAGARRRARRPELDEGPERA